MKKLIRVIVLLSLSLCLACASIKPRPTIQEPPKFDTPLNLSKKEKREYRKIKGLFRKGKRKAALLKMASYEKRFPTSKQLPFVFNLKGLLLLQNKKANSSAKSFERALGLTTDIAFIQYLRFNMASAQFADKQFRKAQLTAGMVEVDFLDTKTMLKFHYLRSQLSHQANRSADAAYELLESARAFEEIPDEDGGNPLHDSSLHFRYKNFLHEVTRNIPEAGTLQALVKTFDTSPILEPLLYEAGLRATMAGSHGIAEIYFRRILADFPTSKFTPDVKDRLQVIVDQASVDTNAIGIMLPMTGKFARFGQKSLHGIELAFDIFHRRNPDQPGFTLHVEDTGETEEQAVRALNNLFFNHHVVAVIGPLTSKGVSKVTERAQELGVPLLNLAQRPGTEGNYVFQAAVSPRNNAYELARHAIQKENLQRFAIMYPDDRFGREYSDHFWDAVESLGGTIISVEPYPSGQTDFRSVVDKLSGRFYKNARWREQEELSRLRDELEIKHNTRKTQEYYELKPIVDYDAVFIPDSTKSAGQIMPTFAYRDVDGMKFIGLSTWNSKNLIQRAGDYAEGAIFVDSFFKNSLNPNVRDFVLRFNGAFNKDPSVIEAIAFDAATVLKAILETESTETTRKDVRDSLASVSGFSGATGKISVNESELHRELKILTVREQQIVEADPTISD